MHSVEIAEILSLFSQKFRESNSFTKEITKQLICRIFFSVRENYCDAAATQIFHEIFANNRMVSRNFRKSSREPNCTISFFMLIYPLLKDTFWISIFNQCCQKVFTEFRAKSSKISEISASFQPNFGLFRALFSKKFRNFAPASDFYSIFT